MAESSEPSSSLSDFDPPTTDSDPIKEFLKRLDLIHMTPATFDTFCSTTRHVLRSLRGHAFEVWFDDLMQLSGYDCKKQGGDDVADRILNGHSLQLKTPYWTETEEGKQVAFRMHKTHGREKYPEALYRPSEFADYLVGMHPDRAKGVVICPADELQTRAKVNPNLPWSEYISDPVPFEWDTPWLNRWDLLGVENSKLVQPQTESSKVLPKTSKETGFSDIEVIRAIVSKENFRVWQQLIVGSVREYHFEEYVKTQGISLEKPVSSDMRGKRAGARRVKIDYVYVGSGGRVRIQVKGLTRGMCDGNTLGVETQGSHSRKPTRFYLRTDFEVLAVVIDPGMIPPETAKKLGVNHEDYNFLFKKMSDLELHEQWKEWGGPYIKPRLYFDVSKERLDNIKLLTTYSPDGSSSLDDNQSTP